MKSRPHSATIWRGLQQRIETQHQGVRWLALGGSSLYRGLTFFTFADAANSAPTTLD